MADLRVGATFAGYRIEAEAGRGGMGVVYRARQLALDRVVAIKAIAPEFTRDDRFRERFRRESRIAASIEHPHVIPIYEAGEVDGQLYLAMRWVEGTDLRDVLAREGALAPSRSARLVAGVAAALAAAHGRGLVHRDVKPANVLLAGGEEAEHAYLTDFGIALQSAEAANLTKTGAVLGTMDYLAPERFEGDRGDARSDVYALGCVFYELLTGRVPYPRDSEVAKMFAHVNDPVPSLLDARPGMPPGFDAIIARAMAKDPAERYPSTAEMARAVSVLVSATETGTHLAAASAIAVGAPIGEAAPASTPPEVPDGPPGGAPTEEGSTATPGPPSRLLPSVGEATPEGEPVPDAGEGAPGVEPAPGAVADRRLEESAKEPQSPLEPWKVESDTVVIESPSPDVEPDRTTVVPGARGTRRRRRGAAALAGVVVLAAVVTAVALLPGDREGELAATPRARVEPPIAVGGSPDGIGEGAGSVWVALAEDDAVARIDPVSRTAIAAPIRVGPEPDSVAVGEGAVWVTANGDDSVTRIDLDSGDVDGIPVGAGPEGIAVGAGAVWVANSRSDTISQIDPAERRISATAPVGDRPVAVQVGDGAVWATNSEDDTVSRINLGAGTIESVEVGRGPHGLAVTDEAVWVVNSGEGTVTRLDPESGRSLGSPIRVGSEPAAIAVDDSGAWVTNNAENTVSRLDPRTGRVLDRRLDVGRNPVGVTVTPNTAWVANFGDRTVAPIAVR